MNLGYIGAWQHAYRENGNRTSSAGAASQKVSFEKLLGDKSGAQTGTVKPYGGVGGSTVPWGRTAARVNYSMVDYVSTHKNGTLADFTAAYQKSLAAKGASDVDYAAMVKGAKGFADVFSDYKVMTKVGNPNVSSGNWQRNDFPFWQYFNENTSADALNNWGPVKAEPDQLDPSIQRNTASIGSGKISILIPEKLQAKMDADPAYAQEIYAKTAKWKTEYDRWDNATAASLGMNVAEHQFSKSYCLQLDEEGNVANATVTSGGGEITQSDDSMVRGWGRRHLIPYHSGIGAGSFMNVAGLAGLSGLFGFSSMGGFFDDMLLTESMSVAFVLRNMKRSLFF